MGNKGLTVQARALWRAADILGGKDELRAALRVPMPRLEEWLQGAALPPMDIFLKAVDIISTPSGPVQPAAIVARSRLLRHRSGELIANAERQIERAREALVALPRTRAFLEATFQHGERAALLESALDAALEAGRAPLGNLQLRDEQGLRIVASRGFQAPFLEFFARVQDASSACGTALSQQSQIVVSDVAADPIFAGGEAGAVLHAAGARAVQSTPLLSAYGQVLGVLSTHYDHPYTPEEPELEIIDHIARRTAFWLGEAGA